MQQTTISMQVNKDRPKS